MRATATAPANIALIKYWGQSDPSINLPNNDSVSFNLSNAFTETTVEFLPKLKTDQVQFNGAVAPDKFTAKVTKQLDWVRSIAGTTARAQVNTTNNFPTGAGIASSASGMAALSVAGAKALGLDLSTTELSILARKGSGSACRSIPDGFVIWHKGTDDASSYAESLYPADYWDIHNTIVVVQQGEKKVSSLAGHQSALTSTLYPSRISAISKSVAETLSALKRRDFTALGETAEAEAINLHAIMMTSRPSVMYWSPETLLVIEHVKALREAGVECYFTIDAGANVHVLSQGSSVKKVAAKFSHAPFVKTVISAQPAIGARVLDL